MRKITQEEFDKIYEEHRIWLTSNQRDGKRANFELVDFSGITFPPKANLRHANLYKTVLLGADLQGADLREANLQGADLEDANLRGAKFEGAKVPNDIPGNKEQKIIEDYQNKINQLERERIGLITSEGNKDAEIKKNQEQLDNLKKELDKLNKELQDREEELNVAKENRTKIITTAFDTLIHSGDDLKEELKNLKKMFYGYLFGIILAVVLLYFVWHRFYGIVDKITQDNKPKMEIIDVWSNISPSFLLVSLIIFFIFQMHKCQRQMVALQKFLYKPKQIEGILNAYTYISPGADPRVDKVLDSYVDHIINQDIDTAREESSMKESDKKEAGTNEKLLDTFTEIIKKIKL